MTGAAAGVDRISEFTAGALTVSLAANTKYLIPNTQERTDQPVNRANGSTG